VTSGSELSLDCSVHLADSLEVPSDLEAESIESLVHFALGLEGQQGHWIVNIALVDEDEISRLHDRFLGDSAPTDIITFPHDEQNWHGGDIAICVPVAAEQGPEHGKTFIEELLFLVLHGLLHLSGRSDDTAERRADMLGRQQVVYDAWLAASR